MLYIYGLLIDHIFQFGEINNKIILNISFVYESIFHWMNVIYEIMNYSNVFHNDELRHYLNISSSIKNNGLTVK